MKRSRVLAIAAIAGGIAGTASAASLTLGPKGVQALVTQQLFGRSGRWVLIDDGGVCYTYLDTPRTQLESGRLILTAHLTSRLGQRVGDTCIGADFFSNVTLSGTLRATDQTLVLQEIHIDRVDDEATRNALALALQLAPDALPRSTSIDALDLLRRKVLSGDAVTLRVDQLHIAGVTTRPEGVLIQFDVNLSTP